MTTATADPLRRIIEDRVEILLRYRHWYRAHPQVKLGGLERIHNAELRALVRLLRAARLQEKADTVWRVGRDPLVEPNCDHKDEWERGYCRACGWPVSFAPIDRAAIQPPESADPLTQAKGYWDWVSER